MSSTWEEGDEKIDQVETDNRPKQTRTPRKRNFKMDFTQDHYKVSEVATFLGFTERTIRNWIDSKRNIINYIEINGSIRIPVKEVLRLSGRSTDILSEK